MPTYDRVLTLTSPPTYNSNSDAATVTFDMACRYCNGGI